MSGDALVAWHGNARQLLPWNACVAGVHCLLGGGGGCRCGLIAQVGTRKHGAHRDRKEGGAHRDKQKKR